MSTSSTKTAYHRALRLERLEPRQMLSASMPTGPVLAALSDTRNWITYTPSQPYNPNLNIQPTEAQIQGDLQLLFNTGFRGLVTYSLDGVLQETARIAKSVGFTQVIAGAFWFDDAQLAREKTAALQELPYIDAFIVGNEGLLEGRYTRARLEQEIAWFQTNTLKPVSTTETGGQELADPTLIDLGDFATVNIQPWFNGSLNPSNPAAMATAVSNEYTALKNLRPDRSIFVKEAWYSTTGNVAATQANQTAFFAALANTPVKFVWGEAFDQPWKSENSPFGTLGPGWGMFTGNRTPKSIVSDLANVYIGSYNRVDEVLGRALTVLRRMNQPVATGGLPINEATAADLDLLAQGTVPTGQRQWVPGQLGFGLLAQVGSHAYRKLKSDVTGGLSDSELHAALNATLVNLETIFSDPARHYTDPATQGKALYQRYDTITATPLFRDAFENAIPLIDNAELFAGLRAASNYLSGLRATDLDGSISQAQFTALATRINALLAQMDFRMWFDGTNLRIGAATTLGTNPIPASGASFDRITSETRLAAVAARANGDLSAAEFNAIVTGAISNSKIGSSPNGSLIDHVPFDGTSLELVGATPLLASELGTLYGQGTLLASVRAHRNVADTIGGLPAYGATGIADGSGGFRRLALAPSENSANPDRNRQVLVTLAAGMEAGALGKTPVAGLQAYGDRAVKNLEDAIDAAQAAAKYHPTYGLPNAIDLGAGIINATPVWGYLEVAEFATSLLQYKLGGDFFENLLRGTSGWNVALSDYRRLLNEREMEAVASNAPGVSAFRPGAGGGILDGTLLAGQARNIANTWHIETVGNTLKYPLSIAIGGRSSVLVTYSNDDTGVGDTIEVLLDGKTVNSFHAVDTNAWTSFTTAAVDLGIVPPGLHELSFRLTVTDGFGIDFDKFGLLQWNNAAQRGDVDDDGSVSGIDLIYVVEAINTPGDPYLLDRLPRPTKFVDLNGDNFVTGIDLVLAAEAINTASQSLNLAPASPPSLSASSFQGVEPSIAIGVALAMSINRGADLSSYVPLSPAANPSPAFVSPRGISSNHLAVDATFLDADSLTSDAAWADDPIDFTTTSGGLESAFDPCLAESSTSGTL